MTENDMHDAAFRIFRPVKTPGRWRKIFAIICLSMAIRPAVAEPPERVGAVPKILADQGVSESKFKALKSGKLISSGLEAENCSVSDASTYGDKLLLSDLAIRAVITKIEYLYKEGGPYRTLYTLDVKESFKGKATSQVQFLSKYGPNSRDHRRWKTDPSKVELEVGDEGIFLLTNRKLLRNLDKAPASVRPFLKDKYILHRGMAGVYIFAGDEADKDFLAKSGKTETRLSLPEVRRTSRSIQTILETEP